jgi:hypothetical protein
VLKDFELVCVTESELMQWQARGLMHLAADRILPAGSNKSALFALAPLVKLDDAKARVVINLTMKWRDGNVMHPKFQLPNLLCVDWDQILSIAPVLPQYRRRLESFNLPIEEWNISELWDEWLVTQGSYERLRCLQSSLCKLSFNAGEFLANEILLEQIIKTVARPNSTAFISSDVPRGWKTLFENRDGILKKLRFDGHSDRMSFLESSVREILQLNGCSQSDFKLDELVTQQDYGWKFQDLTLPVLNSINRYGGDKPNSMDHQISPIFGAIYLRLYDEIFYGQANWNLCFNLLRFSKYSLDSDQADFLTVAIFASFSAEEIRSLDLVAKFYGVA